MSPAPKTTAGTSTCWSADMRAFIPLKSPPARKGDKAPMGGVEGRHDALAQGCFNSRLMTPRSAAGAFRVVRCSGHMTWIDNEPISRRGSGPG